MLFWWEKNDDIIPVGGDWRCYSGGRRMMMLFWWEKDDDVIPLGEG